MPIVTAEDLSFKIDNKTIFTNLGISLFPGSITHLKGANGSGKSSLLKILCGLQQPSSGSVKLGKRYNIEDCPKPFANYIGHNIGVKDDLTVLENIEIFARLYESEITIPSALHYFSLMDVMNEKAYSLSAGNRQKIALARLLCCHAGLWLLDEVDSHLDEKNKVLLHNVIATKANNGGVIILTSHQKLKFKNIIGLNIEDFHE